MAMSYEEHSRFFDKYETAASKAKYADNTADFLKHCHTLIHLCSKAINKDMPMDAGFVYSDLKDLIQTYSVEF